MTSPAPATDPLFLHLAIGPEHPGWTPLMAELTARGVQGSRLQVLLTADGLAAAEAGLLEELPTGCLLEVCSLNARERGWTAESTPGAIGWSSLATWTRRMPADATLWSLLP